MRVLITTSFLLTYSLLAAQFNVNWLAHIGGDNTDTVTDLMVTSDGSFLLTANTKSSDVSGGFGDSDIWLVKVSIDGEILWEERYGQIGFEYGTSCIEVDDGYVVSGYTTSTGSYDLCVFKIDAEGVLLWEHTYGGSSADWIPTLINTRDGGFAMLASSWSDQDWPNYGVADILFMKLFSDGTIEWTKNYGGSQVDLAVDFIQEDNGDFVIAGNTKSNDIDVAFLHSERDFWLLRLTETGDVLWEKTFGGGAGSNTLENLTSLTDGYLLVGQHGGNDCWLIKTDKFGQFVWQRSIGGTDKDIAYDVIENEAGLFGCGDTQSQDGDIREGDAVGDALVFQLDHDGNILWTDTYGGSLYDSARRVLSISDSSYVMAGYSYSSDGDLLNNAGLIDIWVIKLSLIQNYSSTSRLDTKSSQVVLYPNPSSDNITIQLSDENLGYKYSISNSYGQEIKDGVIKQTSFRLETQDLVAGVYMFNIFRKGSIDSVKFLVAK